MEGNERRGGGRGMIGSAGRSKKFRRFHFTIFLLLDANQELGIRKDAQARQINRLWAVHSLRYYYLRGRAESRILNLE